MNLTNTVLAFSLGLNFTTIIGVIATFLIGLLVAFLVVQGWKGQLKSVVRQSNASSYRKEGSLRLSVKKDAFLYTKVDKREKPQNNR